MGGAQVECGPNLADCQGAAVANAVGYGVTSFLLYTPAVFLIAIVVQWCRRMMRGR
jgi:hypothetical protein